MKCIEEKLQNNILLLDGAMGTTIQQEDLTAEDFGGEEYEGCNEYLVETRPDVILKIHKAYIEAGADIIETNTFGATNIVLSDYELSHLDESLNEKAAFSEASSRRKREGNICCGSNGTDNESD